MAEAAERRKPCQHWIIKGNGRRNDWRNGGTVNHKPPFRQIDRQRNTPMTHASHRNRQTAITATPKNRFTEIQLDQKMKTRRFILASNKVKKIDCPFCGARKHWQRYLDTRTGKVLPPELGKCDNLNKCGAWVSPKSSGYAESIYKRERDHENVFYSFQSMAPILRPDPKPIYFKWSVYHKFIKNPESDFLQNLKSKTKYPFPDGEIKRVSELYYLGTIKSGYMAGGVCFPFIDNKGKIRTVQIKTFDEDNHTKQTNYLHSILSDHYKAKNQDLPGWLTNYLKNEKKVSCLFGEHLLKNHAGPVALVEAPKTAIYCHLYFKDFTPFKNVVWLATGALGYFTFERVRVLTGRTIYVFPDLSKKGQAFDNWKAKAEDFIKQMPGTRFVFSDLLERIAPDADRVEGKDIADYLIKLPWEPFKSTPCPPAKTKEKPR